MITKVWYYVSNGGDGSVRTNFVESKELAELFDSLDDERYEEAVGSIEIESEGPIKIPEMITIDEAIAEAEDDINESWWDEDDQEKLDAFKALKDKSTE